MRKHRNNTDIKILILVVLLIFIALTQTGCSPETTDPRLKVPVANVEAVLKAACGITLPNDITFIISNIKKEHVAGYNKRELDFTGLVVVDIDFYETYGHTYALEYLLIHEIWHDLGQEHISGHFLMDVTTNYSRLSGKNIFNDERLVEVCESMKRYILLKGLPTPAISL